MGENNLCAAILIQTIKDIKNHDSSEKSAIRWIKKEQLTFRMCATALNVSSNFLKIKILELINAEKDIPRQGYPGKKHGK